MRGRRSSRRYPYAPARIIERTKLLAAIERSMEPQLLDPTLVSELLNSGKKLAQKERRDRSSATEAASTDMHGQHILSPPHDIELELVGGKRKWPLRVDDSSVERPLHAPQGLHADSAGQKHRSDHRALAAPGLETGMRSSDGRKCSAVDRHRWGNHHE
jgi:hypothetical protein